MAQPKRRHSPTRQAKRRLHDVLPRPAVRECTHCHAPVRPHNACPKCGYYKGRKADHTIKEEKSEK